MEPDGPVVVLAFHRILQWLALRMTLDAGVIGGDEVQLRRVDDVHARRIGRMIAARSVTSLTSDVPFGYGFRLDVVIDGVTSIAERSGRTFIIVGRIKAAPTNPCSAARNRRATTCD